MIQYYSGLEWFKSID